MVQIDARRIKKMAAMTEGGDHRYNLALMQFKRQDNGAFTVTVTNGKAAIVWHNAFRDESLPDTFYLDGKTMAKAKETLVIDMNGDGIVHVGIIGKNGLSVPVFCYETKEDHAIRYPDIAATVSGYSEWEATDTARFFPRLFGNFLDCFDCPTISLYRHSSDNETIAVVSDNNDYSGACMGAR